MISPNKLDFMSSTAHSGLLIVAVAVAVFMVDVVFVDDDVAVVVIADGCSC